MVINWYGENGQCFRAGTDQLGFFRIYFWRDKQQTVTLFIKSSISCLAFDSSIYITSTCKSRSKWRQNVLTKLQGVYDTVSLLTFYYDCWSRRHEYRNTCKSNGLHFMYYKEYLQEWEIYNIKIKIITFIINLDETNPSDIGKCKCKNGASVRQSKATPANPSCSLPMMSLMINVAWPTIIHRCIKLVGLKRVI